MSRRQPARTRLDELHEMLELPESVELGLADSNGQARNGPIRRRGRCRFAPFNCLAPSFAQLQPWESTVQIRRFEMKRAAQLQRLLEPFLPKVVVLAPLEIPPVVEVQFMGVSR